MANNSEITYVFSIDITRIYSDGHEEGLDDMQAARTCPSGNLPTRPTAPCIRKGGNV